MHTCPAQLPVSSHAPGPLLSGTCRKQPVCARVIGLPVGPRFSYTLDHADHRVGATTWTQMLISDAGQPGPSTLRAARRRDASLRGGV